jgi:hypothetical protein
MYGHQPAVEYLMVRKERPPAWNCGENFSCSSDLLELLCTVPLVMQVVLNISTG